MAVNNELIVRIAGDASKYQDALKEVKKETEDLEKSLATAAKISGAAFAAGAASIGLAARAAGQFESKFSNVVTLLDDGSFKSKNLEEGIDGLREGVLALGKESGQSFETLNAGLFDLISSGVPAEKAIDTLRVTTELAAAGATDTATAVQALTASFTAFGEKAGTANDIAEKFFTAQKFGVTTVGALATEFNKVAGLANNLGVSFDEALASLSSLTADGAKPTAEAATQLRAALNGIINVQQNLSKESEAVQQALSLQNLEQKGLVGALQDLKQATGGNIAEQKRLLGSSEALQAVISLTGNQADLVAKQMNAMADAKQRAATFSAALETKQKTTEIQIARFSRAVESAAIVIGEQFAPLIGKAAELLTDFIGVISENQGIAKFAALVLGVGTAIAGLTATLAVGATAFLNIRAAIIAANIAMRGLSISIRTVVGATGIGLLIVAASLVLANWETIWPAVKETFVTFANAVIPIAEDVANFFINAFNAIVDGAIKFGKAYISIWRNILSTFKNVASSIGDILVGIFTLDEDRIEKGLAGARDALVNGVKGALDDVKKIVTEDTDPIIAPIKLGKIDTEEAQKDINEQSSKLVAPVMTDTVSTQQSSADNSVDQLKQQEKEKTEALNDEQKRRIANNKAALDILAAQRRRATQEEIELIRRRNDLALREEQARKEENAQVRESELSVIKAQREQLLRDEARFQEQQNEIIAQQKEQRLVLNEEFNELEKEQVALFNEEERIALEETVLTKQEAEEQVARELLERQIARRNQFLKDEAQFGKTSAKLRNALATEEVLLAKQTSSELVGLSQSRNNTLKSIGKAAAVTQIGIDTAQGAASIFAKLNALVPFLAPGIGAAGAAAIVAFGAEKTANVLAANTGGIVPRNLGIPGRDSVPSLLTPGELVVPERNFDEVVTSVANQRVGGGNVTDGDEAIEPDDQGIDITITLEPTGDLTEFIEQQVIERRVQGVGIL